MYINLLILLELLLQLIMNTKTPTLAWIDYLVIIATMGISVSIGLYYRFSGGRQKTTQVYSYKKS
jgi:hypothetical protein